MSADLLELVAHQTGLTPDEIDEACLLAERLKTGSIDPVDWANLEALLIMARGGREVVQAIAAGGLDRFITVAKPELKGHAFRHVDYKRMYRRICAKAERG
jgi:hypothetical protein